MFNSDFIDLVNSMVWAVGTLYVVCAGVVMRHTVKLGNKKEAQRSSIYAIAESKAALELYDIIISIIEENARILMPTKTNWLLIILTGLGVIFAISTLFLAKAAQANPDIISYWAASSAFFIVFFVFSSLLLWFQYKYVVTLKRLQDKHEDGGKKVIQIMVK